MADPVGEFLFKHTGNMLAKTDDGQVSINANWEGEATGYGGVFGTPNITQPLDNFNNKSGTCSWVGQGFLDDGTTVGGLGEGTWEQQTEGQHKWIIKMDIVVSNGDQIHTESEIDLAARTFEGKIYPAG